jgi:CDP-glucose 4,6-dehydratase
MGFKSCALENMVMKSLFRGAYNKKTVLVTGHTGFKGSWLTYWLTKMGANVIGYSLEAPTTPNHISELNLEIISIIGDIRDYKKLNDTIEKYKPEIVFHLAAQPIVRISYQDPISTYETNVVGTLKVFEACRKSKVKAIVNITSDKVYENKEWVWGYRESDQLGGYDPYSSSKAAADILTNSYRNSYFNQKDYNKNHNSLLASCRSGNVIGGGDWAQDRLFTDIMLSIANKTKVIIRNPDATRPWQHVLEPLSGYLHLGQKLLQRQVEFGDSWNFGPPEGKVISVKNVLDIVKKHWSDFEYEVKKESNQPHEANLLQLNCSKANLKLNWKGIWSSDVTFEKTVRWYKAYYLENKVLTSIDLQSYINDAKSQNLEWSQNA